VNAWQLVATGLLLSCASRPPSGARTNTATHPRADPTGGTATSPGPDASRGRHWLLWGTEHRTEARGLRVPSSSVEPQRFPGLRQGTWSADGSLFVSCDAEGVSTFRVGSDGPIALERSSLPCFAASWAPSGRGLLVRRDALGSQWSWFADVTALQAIAEFATPGIYGAPGPVWAASGVHATFASPRRSLEFVTLPVAGQPINLVPPQSDENGAWHGCAWSPVGSKLACVVSSFKKGVRGARVTDGFRIVVRDADQPSDPAIEVAHLLTTGVPNQLTWIGTKWLAFGLPPKADSSKPSNPWGSLHAVRVAPGSTPVLVEDGTFVWAAAPGSGSTLAYVGDCPAHGACLVELEDSGPSPARLVARGDFRSLTWSKQGGRLLIRESRSLRLLENAADRNARAVLVARAPGNMRIDGDFTPDAQWVEVRTMHRAYLVSQPGPAVQPEPGRNQPSLLLWHIAKRALIPLEFPGEALPWRRFWAPDDTSFAFLVFREKAHELWLMEIRDGKPLAPRRLDQGRELSDAWVSWQPKSQ
jgi:hypothetical protein